MTTRANNRLFLFATFCIVLAIYLLTLSQNQAIAHDGIIYSTKAKEGVWVFHPHHLLYHVFTLSIVKFLHLLGLQWEVFLIMSAINSIFGAGLITLIVKILVEQYSFEKVYAAAAAGVIAFSYGVWYYSTCVEVYIIPLFFALLSFYFYLKNPVDLAKIAISASIATLFHQTYVFLLAVYTINYFVQKVNFKQIVRFTAFYSIFVGIPYILVLLFAYKVRSIDEAYYQLTFYAQELPYFWSRFGIGLLVNDLVGFLRTIFSIHLLLSFSPFINFINHYFSGNSFQEEIFLVRNATLFDKIFGIAFLLIAVALLLYFSIISVKTLFKSKGIKQETWWIASYVLFFGGFFTFWSSNNLEFWISTFVFIALYLIIINKQRFNYKFYLIFALTLAIYNFVSTTQFTISKGNDFYQTKIDLIKNRLDQSSLLIIDNSYMLQDYLHYNGFKNVVSINDLNAFKNNFKGAYFIASMFRNDLLSLNNEKLNSLKENYSIEKIEIKEYEIFKIIHKTK